MSSGVPDPELDELVELARVREEPLTLKGPSGKTHELVVIEPSALQNIEYRTRRVKSMEDGIAFLISECVLDAATRTPRWTFAQAKVIAGGRAEVFAPVVNTITGFLTQKKEASSAPSSESSTG